jgi:hypothetical protein
MCNVEYKLYEGNVETAQTNDCRQKIINIEINICGKLRKSGSFVRKKGGYEKIFFEMTQVGR